MISQSSHDPSSIYNYTAYFVTKRKGGKREFMVTSKLKRYLKNSSQAGFTLIESMVAMVLVSVLAVSISPMLGFWVATRVQARRVELGAIATRTYIEGVQSGAIEHPKIFTANPCSIAAVSGTGKLECNPEDNNYCTTPELGNGQGQLYCMNNDQAQGCQTDSTTDIVLHVGSFNPSAANEDDFTINANLGYQLGVRAYRADAFKLSEQLEKGKEQSSTGLGNPKMPLIEISTIISTQNTTYSNMQNLIQLTQTQNSCN